MSLKGYGPGGKSKSRADTFPVMTHPPLCLLPQLNQPSDEQPMETQLTYWRGNTETQEKCKVSRIHRLCTYPGNVPICSLMSMNDY